MLSLLLFVTDLSKFDDLEKNNSENLLRISGDLSGVVSIL